MRRLIGLLTITCAAWAQTQIQDTIYTPFSGQLFEGVITITGPAMKTQDGRTVARWIKQVTVNNGVLNIGLEPNDTATPQGTSYTVVYRTRSGLGWTEYWIVPTSATPLRVADVRITQPPVPQMMIQPSQILDGGASDGQMLTWDASTRRWVPRDAPPPGAHEHSAGDITSGTFADARIGESNVTQHQAALRLDASQIASGTLGLSRGGTGQTEWTAGRCVQVAADGSRLESADAPCGTGGGGGVGGSGTAGTIPVWTDSTTLGNSSLSEGQDAVTVAKRLVVSGAIESQSSEPGAAVLFSVSGGSVTLEAPDTSDNVTITVPAANGTLALEGHEHDAAAIASGVLPVARGGTGKNSYIPGRCLQSAADGQSLIEASGACSVEGHEHTLSGDVSGNTSATSVVRIQGRAVSSEAPSDGQALVWDGAGQQWRPGTVSGGGSGGWDPMDTSTLVLRDDFCSGGTSGGQVGALGWSTSTIAGTAIGLSYNVGSSTHPCELRGVGVSSVNPNDGRSLYLVNPTGPFQNASSTGNWEAKFIWQYPTTVGELRARVGLVKSDEPNVLVPTAFIGLRFDVDSNWDPSGSTFIACVCNGNTKGNCTDIDTQVAVSANAWYKLHVWSDAAGVIKMRLNDGAVITFDNPSTLPASNIDFQPAWIVGRTGGTGNRQAYIDFFAAKVTGLAR